MKNTASILHGNRIYFISLAILLFAGFLLLLLQGNSAAGIPLHGFHPFWLNVFFINYTFMGDGIFAACLIALYLFYFKKKQEGMALLYALIFSAIAVQVIKNLVGAQEPAIFFEPGQYLFFAGDVSLAGKAGFPSGHTATAFAIATVFIIMMKNKKWQLPVLFAAALVGYSRMYLAQNLLTDILLGACIGTGGAIASVSLVKAKIKLSKFGKTKFHYRPQEEYMVHP